MFVLEQLVNGIRICFKMTELQNSKSFILHFLYTKPFISWHDFIFSTSLTIESKARELTD